MIDVTLSTGYREWMEDAYCHQFPADMWHPEDAEGVWIAKALCKSHCPVVAQCLKYALEAGETYPESGVRGGTSPKERRKLAAGEDITSPACRRNHPGEESDETLSPVGKRRCRTCERVKDARQREKRRERAQESGAAA